MEAIIRNAYDIETESFQKMEGYGSLNYKVTSGDKTYVLKIYPLTTENLQQCQGENQCLRFLDNPHYPQVIKNKKGDGLTIDDYKIYRLLTFLEGKPFGQSEYTPELFSSLGRFIANLDKGLENFENVAIRARKYTWDLQHFTLNVSNIDAITDPTHRSWVKYLSQQFQLHARDKIPNLRMAYIHNDVNLDNLLTKDNQISGLFDFGDMVYSPLINNLAVCLTYALMDKEDPLNWAIPVIRSYHDTYPLEKSELDVLYYLIGARLCTSVIHSSLAILKEKSSEYIISNQQQAWHLISQWLRINPKKARNTFYEACNYRTISDSVADPVIIDKRKTYFSKTLSLSYQTPIRMSGAAFQYMYGADGSSFLDAYNNIPHVGHCHPTVVEAGQRAMARLNTNTRYLYPELTEYAEKLLSRFPDSLSKVFLVNSGSAATDLAVRLAKAHTKKQKMLVLENGYHGNTQVSIDLSHYKFAGKGGSGSDANICALPMPDAYRHPFGNNQNVGPLYAAQAISEIQKLSGEIAGFIGEPIVGCGGQVPLAPGYLKEIYKAVRAAGGICISDEVQTGFGRLGKYFWGYELHNVIPDIVILGKPIANGHPMGAVICTEDIAASFENGMEFFSSFGGNPVSCAIGSAVLNVIHEENLQNNARFTGDYFMDRLKKVQEDFQEIGDIRGHGLFIGIDLVTDPSEKSPATELARHVKNEMRQRQILVSTDGPFDNVIKMKPPMCFNRNNVNEVVVNLRDILAHYPGKKS